MEQPKQFRSAFNGFNREDVVRYLEYINNKHSSQMAQLNNELDQLRRKQEAAPVPGLAEELASVLEENDALHLQISDLQARIEELSENRIPAPAEDSELRALLAEAENSGHALQNENEMLQARIRELEEALSKAPVAQQSTAAELEAYRRAERVERLAKERANQVSLRTTAVLTEAGARVEDAADWISGITGQIMTQLEQLTSAMHSSKQTLREAAGTVAALHADTEEE